MEISIKNTDALKRRLFGATFGLVTALCATLGNVASAQLPQIPVYLKEPVAPNVVLTVDNSGSMAWTYVPDAPSWTLGNNARAMTHPALLASQTNPLAFNPDLTVSYDPPRDANGVPFAVTFTAARRYGLLGGNLTVAVNGNNTTNTVNLSTSYQGTTALNLAATLSETTYGVAKAAFYTTMVAGCSPTVDADVKNVACFVEVPVTGAVQQQRFANWYSFYRSRHLSLKSGMLRALYDLDATTRITWQSLPWNSNPLQARCSLPGVRGGNCPSFSLAAPNYNNQLGPFTGAKRTDLFKWLIELENNNSTPLQAAFADVLTYSRQVGTNNPWGNVPGTTEAPVNACRAFFHVAVTDGTWNGVEPPAINTDNAALTLPDGRAYTPIAPYAGAGQTRLADLAFSGWVTDASTTAANTATPYAISDLPANPLAWPAADYWNPRNDPATWQHVNTFTIGLGLKTIMKAPSWDGETFKSDSPNSGYNAFASGSNWDTAGRAGTEDWKVYDLWHAAINGRGQFFAADKSTDIYDAFQTIFNRISGRSGSAAGSASTSNYVDNGTAIYSATYKTGEWSGIVQRTEVNRDGSLGNVTTTGTTGNQINPSTRMIFTRNRNALPTQPNIEFKANLLNATSISALTNGTNDLDLINYYRGVQSFEYDNAGCTPTSTCKFRKRPTLLGDVLGSSPVYSKEQDFGYRSAKWAGGGVSYFEYLKTKASNSGLVLVGANDGMLHGLDPITLQEKFAYIPTAIFDKMWRLKESSYSKQAFVDGPIGLGDAFIGGGWKTIAVVTLGAGGRSVSAIDVTPGVAIGPSQLLWEFTDPVPVTGATGNDLGYVTSKPVITRLDDGTWVALFSGGYESPNKTATLYAINVATGALVQKLVMPNATDACGVARPTPANGLGGVSVARTKSGKVRVYAGDLYGRLWRFENPVGTNTLVAAYSGEPLLKACNGDSKVQPITASPAVDSLGAEHIVYAGTGRMLLAGDASNTDTQSFYAVISDNEAPPTGASRTTRFGQRTVTTVGDGRAISNNAINLVTKRGWFVDLPQQGERVTATPSLVDGRIAFATFVPEFTGCQTNGESWAFNLDALDGKPANIGLFDVNGDGVIDANDKISGPSGFVFAGAMRFDGTITGFTVLKRLDRPGPGASGGGPDAGGPADVCGKGKMKLVANRLYQSGVQGLCTPSQTLRSGWRQLR
jgi:type IV pilus assembly protein PilY1